MATRKYAHCQEPSKIILPLTAQKICAIGSSRGKTHAAVSPNYLLGGSLRSCFVAKVLLSLRAQAWQSRGSGMM